MKKWLSRVGVCVVLLSLGVCGAAPLLAQAPAPGSASEFYLKYRKTFEAAKKVEELLPYMSAATRKQVESTPADERAQMFEFMKMMGAMTSMKIVKEAATGTGATLTVEGVDSDKAKITGTIEIVKEGAAWKLGKENWNPEATAPGERCAGKRCALQSIATVAPISPWIGPPHTPETDTSAPGRRIP